MTLKFWYSAQHAKHLDSIRGGSFDKPLYCTAIINGERLPYTACGGIRDHEPYDRAFVIFPDYQCIGVGEESSITAEDRNYFEGGN